MCSRRRVSSSETGLDRGHINVLDKDVDETFKVAFPRRALIHVDAGLPDETLLATIKTAGPGWIAWSNVLDARGAARARGLATRAGRRGRNVLDNPQGDSPEAWPVSNVTADLGEAARELESAGASAPAGRLAAILDLEPEGLALAVKLIRDGVHAIEIEKAILGAVDPGAAVGKLVGDRGELDPVLVAGYRASAPLLRAFAADPRVRKASAVLAGGAGPALPPLTEKIAPDAAGAAEFGRLMMQLLTIYVGPGRLVRAGGEHGQGIDAIAPDGLPTLNGVVAFHFHWPGDASNRSQEHLADLP